MLRDPGRKGLRNFNEPTPEEKPLSHPSAGDDNNQRKRQRQRTTDKTMSMRQAYSGPTGSKQGETSEPDVRDSSSTANGLAGDRQGRTKGNPISEANDLQEQPVVMDRRSGDRIPI
jgi:hypothetical protein